MEGSTNVITGVLAANPELLLGLTLLEASVCRPNAIEFKQNQGGKRQIDRDRDAAKLLENIVLPDWILEYLRCPQSKGKLFLASHAVLDALLESVRSGALVTVLGRTISQVPSQGLVSADGRWFYSVNDSIARLMADEAVPLQCGTKVPDVIL